MSDLAETRVLVFELLSALAYLRSIGGVPADMRLDDLEQRAYAVAMEGRDPKQLPLPLPPSEPVIVPDEAAARIVQLFTPNAVASPRCCPQCGDAGNKTVRLRPRPRLQCQACGELYPFPAKWG